MKIVKMLTAFAVVFAMSAMVASAELSKAEQAKAKKGGCCDKAIKAGKACAHKCCVAAAKEGKICPKCNAPKKKKK